MIEVPRGALTADEIAQHAAFFSFGTNDLTQMTFGYSRDDAEGGFLLKYVEDDILPDNPFQTLDDAVAGLMQIAVDKGRATRPDLELGICGEHGGDPESIAKCEQIGLDYVSCSPFRSRRRVRPRPAPRTDRRILRRSRRDKSDPWERPRSGGCSCDTAPLRLDRDYRWLWSGQVVNGIGNQITRIALPYQVYVLTGSTLAIAALTLFQLVPILIFALGAGSLADAVDRRKLLLRHPGRAGRLQPRARRCWRCRAPPLARPVRGRLRRGRARRGRPADARRRPSRGSSRPSGCRRPSRSTS